MEKAFKGMGYKTQVRSLADFYDAYGLVGDDEDDKVDPDDDEEDDSDEDGEDDEDMSEGEDDSEEESDA